MAAIETIHNYLADDILEGIVRRMDKLPWQIGRTMNPNSTSENHFAFIQDYSHKIFKETYLKDFPAKFNRALMTPYVKKHNCKSISVIRSRINMYIRTVGREDMCGYHQDYPNPGIKTLLLYLEDSDGCTEFKVSGDRIVSERNKAIIFDSNIEHQTISQTNTLFRHNVNVNFMIND
ncbi:hypothetical protein [Prochlorococcus sp. MIT 1303]|uniref:hypothetical protein n=1 Tax=Prochlorococcus sp. MIT 1303 TaxID=1723647 RepID=UPI0007BB559A|nr:hypothetical protein [Prochlorococcus sp. MIT 1303]KZR67734.1 hypothetical protein PMIT1303_00446 [Prochlorococcus sp. MIT 1303]